MSKSIFFTLTFLLFSTTSCGAKLPPSPIFPSYTTDIDKEVQRRNSIKEPPQEPVSPSSSPGSP